VFITKQRMWILLCLFVSVQRTNPFAQSRKILDSEPLCQVPKYVFTLIIHARHCATLIINDRLTI